MARFIADCQGGASQSRLGSLLKLGMVIGVVQAIVLALFALLAAGWLSAAFSIPPSFAQQFQSALTGSLLAVALGFVFTPIYQLLYASQRIDLINYVSIGTQALSTGVLVACLLRGFQIHSYALAAWAQTVSATLVVLYLARRLGILPRLAGCPTDWATLPSLARFSGNVMMASFGLQLIAIAPAIVINRLLGAAAMGDWAVGTKLIQLGAQLTCRIPNAAEPTLWELFAKGDKSQCSIRLCQTAQIASTVAILTAATLLSVNGNFVMLWSGSRVWWPWINDAMGAGIIVVSALAATWCMLPGITKKLGRMRYIYPAEGFFILGLLAVPAYVTGLASVLLAMLGSMLLTRSIYGLVRMKSDLDKPIAATLSSLRGPFVLAILVLPLAFGARMLLEGNTSWAALAASAAAGIAIYAGLAYAIAIPKDVKLHLHRFLSSTRRAVMKI
jgi:O-antigen/teichoic acid export membrane protein